MSHAKRLQEKTVSADLLPSLHPPASSSYSPPSNILERRPIPASNSPSIFFTFPILHPPTTHPIPPIRQRPLLFSSSSSKFPLHASNASSHLPLAPNLPFPISNTLQYLSTHQHYSKLPPIALHPPALSSDRPSSYTCHSPLLLHCSLLQPFPLCPGSSEGTFVGIECPPSSQHSGLIPAAMRHIKRLPREVKICPLGLS